MAGGVVGVVFGNGVEPVAAGPALQGPRLRKAPHSKPHQMLLAFWCSIVPPSWMQHHLRDGTQHHFISFPGLTGSTCHMDHERRPNFSNIPKAKETDLTSRNTIFSSSGRSGSGSEAKGTPQGRHSCRWRQRQAPWETLCTRDSGGPQVPVGQTEGQQRTLSCLQHLLCSLLPPVLRHFFVKLQAPPHQWIPAPSFFRPGSDAFSLCFDVFQDFLGSYLVLGDLFKGFVTFSVLETLLYLEEAEI